MLASVATHSSRSKIAPAALLELKNACDLFEAASPYGGRAGKFLVRVSVFLFTQNDAHARIFENSANFETSANEGSEGLPGCQQRCCQYSE